MPPPSADSVRRYYRWMAPLYDITRPLFLLDRRHAVGSLGLQAGNSVLEIGTGTGYNLPHLRHAVGPAGSVVGLDFSAEMLRRARRRVHAGGWDNVRLIRHGIRPGNPCG